jgi:hypothetical protein
MTLKKAVVAAWGSARQPECVSMKSNDIIHTFSILNDFVPETTEDKEAELDAHGNVIPGEMASIPTHFFEEPKHAPRLVKLINAVIIRTAFENRIMRWIFAFYRSKRRRATGHDTINIRFSQKRHAAVI